MAIKEICFTIYRRKKNVTNYNKRKLFAQQLVFNFFFVVHSYPFLFYVLYNMNIGMSMKYMCVSIVFVELKVYI